MALTWALLDASGTETGRSEEFDDRDAAEAWLAGAWGDLSALGVAEVALVDLAGGDTLYRMSLAEG